LLRGAQLRCAFTSHYKLHEFGAEKSISWAKPAHFEVFAINYTLWSDMLSTVGDALTQWMMFSPIFGVIQCPNLIVTYTGSSPMNFI
jgi:hypothetical protein